MSREELVVKILSGRKGSNPGGFCSYNDGKTAFEGYLKYCVGSRIPNGHSHLIPEHQPVYEAITFELARRLGLSTPSFFVLLNKNGNVKFEDSNNFSNHKHSGRNYYFFSKRIYEPRVLGLNEIGNEIIDRERVYLDSLMISDILGKRQNYMILPKNNGFGVFYVDLGCSFVHATDGFIRLPNELKKYSRSCSKKKDKCNLKNKTVVGADDTLLVNLEELVYAFEGLTVPTLNPLSRIPISSLISANEISEIDDYVVHGLCKSLHEYKEKDLLI
jgi:hypothetical protein